MYKKVALLFTLFIGVFVLLSCTTTKSQNPKIKSILSTPNKVAAEATVDIKFVVEVSDPNGLNNIKNVFLNLDNLGGAADQEMQDDGNNGDDTSDDGFYTFIMTGYAAPSSAQKIEIQAKVVDHTEKEATDTYEITIVEPAIVKTFTVSKNPITPGDTITFSATVEPGQYPIGGVTIDLSNIGGNTDEPMNDLGGAYFLVFTVPDNGIPPLPSGDYEIKVSAWDDQIPPIAGTKTINLTIIGLKPSITSTNPIHTKASGDMLFEINIKAPGGLAEITKVSGDFTPIGGNATEQLFDNGTNGDLVADDGIFTFNFASASWDPALVAMNTAYVEINIDVEQTSGITMFEWAPLYIYSDEINHVNGTTGNDTSGDGTDIKPFKTIQKSIDQSSNGDLVLVHDGIYAGVGNFDLVYNGKKIIVKSENGADVTTINGGGTGDPNHRIANFIFNETRESMLAGFTLTDGNITGLVNGGVFEVLDSSPSIISCVIKNNSAKERGGIMNVRSGIMTIETNPWMHRCYCENNRSGRSGGAIYSFDGVSTTLTNCVFKNTTLNALSSENVNGGVLFCNDASTYIKDCVFENNLVKNTKSDYDARGGSIYIKSDTNKPDYHTKVINCVFINNTADSAGGNAEGGAIYLYSSGTKVQIQSCTFVGNEAKGGAAEEARGGAICSSNAVTKMYDSILWGNSVSGTAAVGNEIQHYSSTSSNNVFNIYNCCIDNQLNDIIETKVGTIISTNVINDNPLFVTGTNGDFYLEQVDAGGAVNSPCHNKGSDTAENLELDRSTTREDGKGDENIADIGYHYPS